MRVNISMLLAVALILSNLNFANILVVNQSAPACASGDSYYSTISAAVTAASASDTLIICNDGTYAENVIVDKPLNIYGNESGVIVSTPSPSSNVINISANDVNLANFTIKDANGTGSSGIYVTGNNVRIEDCTLSDNYRGIYFDRNSFNTISNVNITSSDDSIYFLTSHHNNISGVRAATTSGGYAIQFSQSSDSNNITDVNVTSVWSCAIGLSQSSDNILSNINATSSNTSAIGIWYGANNNILSNIRATSNSDYALYIQNDASGTNISNAVLDGGFYTYADDESQCGNTFTNVTSGNGKPILFYGNQEGVVLDGNDTSQIIFCNVDSSSISNTNVTGQYADAIDIMVSSNINLSNIITTSTGGYAMRIRFSSDNIISNLNATSSTVAALYIYASSGNNISNSTATGSPALSLSDSSNTVLLDTVLDGGFVDEYISDESQCGNTFTNVTSGNGKPILFYGNQEGVVLDGNDTSQIIFCNVSLSSISNTNATSSNNGNAIMFWSSSNNNISNVNATSNNSETIYLYGSSDIIISHTIATSINDDAVYVETGSNINFSYVNATSYYRAISLSDYSEIILSNSILASDYGYTLYVNYCSDGDISNNTIYAGYSGCTYDDDGDDCYSAFVANGNSGINFLNNTIYSDYWVEADEEDATVFNDSTIGNRYYLFNGTPASSLFNITSSTDTWADDGSDLPFDSSSLATVSSYCIQGAEDVTCGIYEYGYSDAGNSGWVDQNAIQDLNWSTGSYPSDDVAEYYGYFEMSDNTIAANLRVASDEVTEEYPLPNVCINDYSYIYITSSISESKLTVSCSNVNSISCLQDRQRMYQIREIFPGRQRSC